MLKNKVTLTVTMNTKKKLIDIPEDVFRALSIKAAAQGTNLKRYIELMLIRDAKADGHVFSSAGQLVSGD